jgi:hypothetical protein
MILCSCCSGAHQRRTRPSAVALYPVLWHHVNCQGISRPRGLCRSNFRDTCMLTVCKCMLCSLVPACRTCWHSGLGFMVYVCRVIPASCVISCSLVSACRTCWHAQTARPCFPSATTCSSLRSQTSVVELLLYSMWWSCWCTCTARADTSVVELLLYMYSSCRYGHAQLLAVALQGPAAAAAAAAAISV